MSARDRTMPPVAPNSQVLTEIRDLLRHLVSTERPAPRRLLRLREAAKYLRISPAQLRSIIQRGELPIVKPTDHAPWLLDVHDLDDWVNQSKTNFQ